MCIKCNQSNFYYQWLRRQPLAVSPLQGFGFKKFVSINSFPDKREASNKISAQLVKPCRRVIVTPAVTRDYFRIQPQNIPCQHDASHKISAQQVQPFNKLTFYFYSIALYIYYYKKRFLRISDKLMNESEKFIA